MLIKEYRIPLPLTVDEYRIAQLYMIAKKSREESSGAGSGVEILKNEPYEDGPGGNGQFTHKIYHIGSHLPGWVKSLLPKSALSVKEEAWNAYPYTKTRYTCPFIQKFFLEIETYYFADSGNQENVFKLSGSELRNRIVDLIDVVKDQLFGCDYNKDEDPTSYVSQKTRRGPLSENWIEDYWRECKDKEMPLPNGKSIMCAYKLCRVEFRYWGMQTKLENFIHDTALRKTMLRAHRQAWAWQDEWHGLTMEDIRAIEKQTQEQLKMKMGLNDSANGSINNADSDGSTLAATLGSIEKTEPESVSPLPIRKEIGLLKDNTSDDSPKFQKHKDIRNLKNMESSNVNTGTGQKYDLNVAASWRMESIVQDSDSQSDDDDDDEFYDCNDDSTSLAKWSSLDLLTEDDLEVSQIAESNEDSIFSSRHLKTITAERTRSVDTAYSDSPPLNISPHPACNVTVLILVLHAGSILDGNVDLAAKKSDVTTFRGALETVIKSHYTSLVGHIAVRLVPCPSICSVGLNILSSLSPYSFDVSPSVTDTPHVSQDSMPIGALPLLATCTPEYQEAITKTVQAANSVYQEFIKSSEGRGFNGQIAIVGDSMGSLLAYDALCRSPDNDIPEIECSTDILYDQKLLLMAPVTRRRSSSTSELALSKFDFEVGECFVFGSPLGLVLAYRKMASHEDKTIAVPKPVVNQLYNLFHPSDPMSSRIEPLISKRFSMLAPVNIPRYTMYPLGSGQPYHLLESVQSNPQIFSESLLSTPGHHRRFSDVSIMSTVSGVMDTLPLQTINTIVQKWWGTKRIDYALYCPEGLTNFPTNALPHLFHASYWESHDVIAFILRQLGRFELGQTLFPEDKDIHGNRQDQTREKWIRKRTSVKLKNVAANHRANDIICKEGAPQILLARFMYGPLDMITLTGEKVDIHVMVDTTVGEWILLSTEVTDKTGRITYTIPESKALGYGLYPVRMIVRGDHSCVDFSLAVVPPRTECVVFSIDGSFTASVSVTGRDPKVRAGAVDIVRFWQELGYLIIYITGRPDMQQNRVLSWLNQHNFPNGLVSFADGISTDPLGHKAVYLKTLTNDHSMIIHAAYGSSKDISVYSSVGLKPQQIYIVGKVSKKHQSQATILNDGYAAHLSNLTAHGGSRPAQGNARILVPKAAFTHNASIRRRRSAKRTTSFQSSVRPVSTCLTTAREKKTDKL